MLRLRQPGGLHGGEQAVQGTQGLVDADHVGKPRRAAPFGDQHPVGPQLPQRFPHGVPAHRVVHRQGEFTGER